MRLTGTAAIEYAETNRYLLNKYADPIEDARAGLSPEEARKIASADPDLIWINAIKYDGLDYVYAVIDATLPERLIPDCSEADRLPGRTPWNKKTRAEQIGWQYYPILMCTENLDEATAMAKSSGQTDYIVIQATKLSSLLGVGGQVLHANIANIYRVVWAAPKSRWTVTVRTPKQRP